jgi:hypothetical protein
VGDEARLAFSRRTAEISAHLRARGLTGARRPSSRAATVAALVTRADKDLSVSVEELQPGWRERARTVGLGPHRLEALLDRVPARTRAEDATGPLDRAVPDTALVEALGGTRDANASFSRRHAVRAWAASLPRGAPAAAVEERVDAFLSSPFVLAAQSDVRRLDGPGVAERGHVVADGLRRPGIERTADERELRRLEELMRRRGMPVGRGVGHEVERDTEIGLGVCR